MGMIRIATLSALSALLISGCAAANSSPAVTSMVPAAEVSPSTKAALARDYVMLSLEAGTHEAGYIDAYYGPAEWKAAAEANPRSKDELITAATRLRAEAQALVALTTDSLEKRRWQAMVAQLLAAETRLRMMQGERYAFADEAERLFGVRPALKPLSAYDAPLAALGNMLPGRDPLPARVEALSARYTISKEHLKPVFDRAIALCRAASAAHIAMPAEESFALSFVTGKSWSGYNYYQGDFHSKIEVNTDHPIRLPRALDLGCHEGYPGHHLLNMKLEQNLVKQRGWSEFSVYPLFSPLSLIAEGTANYGIALAFPDAEKQRVEREVLMPLAGLKDDGSELYWRVQEAISALSGARLTIAQQYLDGEIDRATAIALSQKYLLMTPERAEQSVNFTQQYLSYVINYGLGEEMVRRHVEADDADARTRWQRMEKLISEPSLPSDL
jgi:hypothetical protein